MAMTLEELLARNAALSGEKHSAQESLKVALLTIDKLKVEIAYLRRMKYGRSSEKLEHAQLELVGGQVAQPVAEPTLAHEGLVRIGELFRVEAEVNGRSALRRRRMRQTRTVPVLTELKSWMSETLAKVSAKSPMAKAIGYSLGNWTALTNFVDDGRIDAHNNTAERALRGVAIGRKNYLHVGSDAGGHTAAVMYTLVGTCRLNGINPQAYLRFVLERIGDWPSNRIDELLPWIVAPQLQPSWSEEFAQAAA